NCTLSPIEIAHSVGAANPGSLGLLPLSARPRRGSGWRREESAGELAMLAHPIAVAPDIHDVAVMDQPINERRRHYFIAEDLAPLLEALVGRQNRGGVLVAPRHELEEEHGARATDREVADLIDDHETRKDERPEPLGQSAAQLGGFER